MDVRNAGDCHNGADCRLLHFHLVQAVIFVKFADFYLLQFIGIVVVYNDHFLVDLDGAVVHFADSDAANIFVIVDGAHQNLCARVGIALGCGNVLDDGVKEGGHILSLDGKLRGGGAGLGGGVDEGAVKLLVICVQIHEKLQHLIHNLNRPRFRAVAFVDAHDHGQIQLQRFFQHKLSLGHRSLKGVHHKDHTVHHFQHALHLAAEVGMAGGVNDVDFGAFVGDGSILGKNGDAALLLNVVGVHDTLRYFLVFPENTALFQKLVHQGGLAVIYMGDNCYISHIFSCLSHIILRLSCFLSCML